ncbi:RagB/SusD family nutrient uptake outer membrane protein [Pseudobacter ginsenosidimutans]|uniref:SusD-like starch-binding protein associating with outer membrane n=1 Tax=Pseudobacter ginsenosidimutans TaxID=661488 RepID=A0A4Q7N1G7_9BACT|nr:RagB/SusD family nutrient uptake outer membrane protein [Pseudobacter ginsenosidimutans]QEC43633.1 RagB/SusD family nutrient uptake outer membrane protein [Pseudobacter ginsenosidimutans]RZS75032.1 SusD-like starch-binding protein associating with outer membrane [Pseudobacter ginsenosidimutans]
MKLMKHILSTLVILHLVSITGCKKFTDVGLPKSQITRDVIFKDDQLAKSAMAGVYRSLEETGFLSGSQSGAQVVLGAYTDELESYAVATNDASVFYQLTHLATSGKILSMWTTTYTQVYNINSIIEGVDNSNGMSAPVRDQLKGEGLFLRAILHLYLAQTYSAVPYVTSTAYDVNQSIGKISVEEVYTKCRKDLEDAQLLLPQTLAKGNRIYPTKMAAYALLARIAYYQSDWNKALAYANEVLDHPQYQMEPELDKVFLKESSSSIWQLLPYSAIYNPYQGNVFILRAAPPTTIALREDFVTDFENGDKRATSWVGQIRSAQNQIYYYPFKYKQYSTSTSSLEHSVILRVEELILIRAEAFLKKQQYDLAVDDLNAIRGRANLSLLEENTDPEDLLNILIKERRSELFTEFGHRYYDLRHYQRLDAVMSVKKTGWKSYYAYWPLPEKELLLNPNLNPQNNGY